MIHGIYSNLASFKSLDFRPGLNIVLSDKSPNASDKDTRNRAGKSSLIELIHFLTGAKGGADSIFANEYLASTAFGMVFDLGGRSVTVERAGESARNVVIVEGNTTDWPDVPKLNRRVGKPVLSNAAWCRVLGTIMFNLATGDDEATGNYAPSFRSLYSYFVRRQSAGGFVLPTRHTEQQQLWDQQVAVSFLLGFDWTIPQELQTVRDTERSMRELRKVAEKESRETIANAGDLRTELTVAEERVRVLRQSISEFRVLPDYRRFEAEAVEVSNQLSNLADANLIDQELIADIERSLNSEKETNSEDVVRLYDEAGVVLPEIVLRRFEEVRDFHESVIRNRAQYLSGELEAARDRVLRRISVTASLERRRVEIFSILKSHGALDHFASLQSELTRLEADSESIRRRFDAALQLDARKADTEIARVRLFRRLQQDYDEQSDRVREAILAFEEISREIYPDSRRGSLIINPSENGPVFEVRMPGSKSKGISNMQIFCFDLAVMKLCTERKLGPGYLVHDSHMFDGVDERQVAKALQVASDLADRVGFQYIATMNSDVYPVSLPSSFANQHVVSVRLTDATEDGGLFGFRFN